MKSARETALLALVNMEKSQAYSNIEQKKELKENELNSNDRALFKQLFFGTLEKKYLLDYYISRLSTIKPHKMSPYVINILRTGLYQLMFLERIPQSAACNEAVKLSKIYARSASGFVNAILRNFLRNRDNLSLPNKSEDISRYLSIKYSVQKWMVNTFIKSYGLDSTEKLLESFNGASPVTARINSLKNHAHEVGNILKADGITASALPNLKYAAELKYSINIEETSSYKEGLFHLQGAASQICCSVLNPQSGETVLDICAAPGGKSFTIAQMMDNRGVVISNDLYEHRTKLINFGAKRLGINIIKTMCADASMPLAIEPEFCDRVLCDAPCSGLGIISKKPEIKYKREEDIKELPDIQLKILTNAAKYLKKGGYLVYSTCTLNPCENEDVTNKFISENKDFEYIDLNAYLPENIKSDNKGYITLLPHVHRIEGFFIALLKKKNG